MPYHLRPSDLRVLAGEIGSVTLDTTNLVHPGVLAAVVLALFGVSIKLFHGTI